MDPTSAAIEQDLPFGFDESLDLPLIKPSAVSETLSFDASTPDLELCRLAAAGNIGGF